MDFRCYHCPAQTPSGFLEFEADRGVCPRCGKAGGQVVPLVAVHHLAPDPKGPILGGDACRYRLACQPKRDHLAVSQRDTFSASGDPRAVTCKSCMGTKDWREAALAFGDVRASLESQGRPAEAG